MRSTPDSISHERALAERAEEVRGQALSDKEFMQQVRDGLAAIARGERGVPLRTLAI